MKLLSSRDLFSWTEVLPDQFVISFLDHFSLKPLANTPAVIIQMLFVGLVIANCYRSSMAGYNTSITLPVHFASGQE